MKASYMHQTMLVLGATAAMAACGPRDDANNAGAGGTGAAGGDVAATTPAPGMSDSAAMGAGASAGASGASAGAATGTATGGTATGASAAPPAVMGIVGVANANEIASSKLAQEKATSSVLKSFANDMVKDHQAMQKDADQLAKKLDVTPQPADRAQELKSSGDQLVSKLQSTAKGAEFDRAYMDGQVQAHQATVQELESLQGAVTDTQVKTLISNAIPKVRAHLERAQRIQQGLGS